MKIYIDAAFGIVFLIVLCWFIYRFFLVSFRYQNMKGIKMKEINKMKSNEFEHYLEEFFEMMDYNVKKVDATGYDGTKFIIEKGTVKTAVQSIEDSKKIDTENIEAASSDKTYYKCDNAMIISNSGFTKQAYNLARVINIHLINRMELITTIHKMKNR
jgi:restriction system protein